jgi:hypothetical protein
MFQNKVGDILAEILSCGEVCAKVDSGKDPAQDCLALGCREGAKGTFHPRQNLGGYVEIELVLLKERSEQEGGASADHRVRSGVRRIGRGFANLGVAL